MARVYWVTQAVAVRDPEAADSGEAAMVVPARDQPYAEGHPLVVTYPWLFRAEGEPVPDKSAPDSVPIPAPIERGTRAPGETRPPAVRRGPGRPRKVLPGVQPDGWDS
jgi:hypothetical protein